MREVNLSGLDLNLLPALDALLRLRNVTQAASEAGLSQPAMSRALARLREIFADALLLRLRRSYALTPKAQSLAPRVAAALAELRGLYNEPGFDPSTERRQLRLVATDLQTILLGPAAAARLAREAPGVDLRFESFTPDIVARLESGAVDLAFALSTTPLPPGAMSEPLGEDRLAVVMRRDHPAAQRPWTIGDYEAFDHAGIAILGDGPSELDARLAAAGVARRLAFVTPHFMAALAAVAASDMVTTISAVFARRFAATFGLVLKEPPFANNILHNALIWSGAKSGDRFLAWFRALLQDVARDVFLAPTGAKEPKRRFSRPAAPRQSYRSR